jgi:hypothetical protein
MVSDRGDRCLFIRRYAQNFGASIYLRVITMKTCSARKLNHGEIITAPLYWRTERDLNWRIFFLFGPRLFLRSEHSVRK